MNNGISQKQAALWLAAAMLAPLAQTAGTVSWLPAAVTGAIALGISCWTGGNAVSPWLAGVQSLWSGVLCSQLLRWIPAYWPDYTMPEILPLLLLGLALWSAKNAQSAARAGCAGIWPMALLLAAVLLSALSGMKLSNLSSDWSMPDTHLITFLLLPCLGGAVGFRAGLSVGMYLWVMIVSVITGAVLSPGICADSEAVIYDLSRTVSMLGISSRFESLAAAAMTIGFFATLSYLLSVPVRSEGMRWGNALTAAVLYLTGAEVGYSLLTLGTILIWVIWPLAERLRRLRRSG